MVFCKAFYLSYFTYEEQRTIICYPLNIPKQNRFFLHVSF